MTPSEPNLKLAAWRKLAADCGIPCMPEDELHGFLSGLASGPAEVKAEAWMPLVFRARERALPAAVADLMPRARPLLVQLYDLVCERVDEDEYHAAFAVERDAQGREVRRPEGWCRGFHQAMMLQIMDWDLFDEAVAEACIPMLYFAWPEALETRLGKDEFADLAKDEKDLIDEIEKNVPKLRQIWLDLSAQDEEGWDPGAEEDEEEGGGEGREKQEGGGAGEGEGVDEGGLVAPEERKVRPTPAGRNEPCPCGSGRKYKKCCGRTDI